MARIYGLNGLIRGRQGNNVFSIQNGTQVVKAYNPAVSNPRTTAQQLQRVKMALAGKISSCAPSAALIGLPRSSNRARRANFVSRIVLASTANYDLTTPPGMFRASVAFRDIIFGVGSLAKYSTAVNPSAAWGEGSLLNASLPAMALTDDAPAGYGEMVICGLFDPLNNPLDEMQVKTRSTASAANFTFRENSRVNCVVAFWIVPFVANTADAGLRSNFLAPNDAQGVELTSTPVSLSLADEFGKSFFIGSASVVAS